MRPVKLTISAFGPYSSKTVIDFDVLEGRNIFLITGPTGAGKTTIFDAISYALYGEASGTSRTTDNLRSDFSNEDNITYVELEFTLRGERYYVKRIPVQPKKRSVSAELIFPDGKIITGATNVTKEIIDLIRIDKNQFRQIVMLPQGEFRRLLESESKEREKIFREIFGTEEFNKIQFMLNIKKKELEEELKAINERRATNLRNITPGEDIFLKESIREKDLNTGEILKSLGMLLDTDKKKSEEIIINKRKVNEKLDALKERYIKAQEGNMKIQEKENLIREKISIDQEKVQIENEEKTLILSRKALEVSWIEKNKKEKQEKHKKIIEETALSYEKAANGEKLLSDALKELLLEEGKDDYRKSLQEKLVNLNSIKEKIDTYQIKRKEAESLNLSLIKEKENEKEIKKQIQFKEKEITRINDELKEISKAETLKERLEANLRDINNSLREIRELYAAEDKIVKLLKTHTKLSEDYIKIEDNQKKIKNKYELLEETYKKGQAGLLAKELVDGIPCPVCGSLNHPMKAVVQEGVPSEEELKRAKNDMEAINSTINDKLNEITRVYTSIKEQRENIKVKKEKLKNFFNDDFIISEDDNTLKLIENVGRETAKKSGELEVELKHINIRIQNKDKLEKEQIVLTSDLVLVKQQQEKAAESILNLFGKIQGEEKVIKAMEEEIPKELRSVEAIEQTIKSITSESEILNRSVKAARDKVTSQKADSSAAKEVVILKEKELQEVKEELSAASQEFDMKLKENGFLTQEEYEKYLISEDEINKIENKVKIHYQNMKSVEDRLSKSIEQCKELEVQDLDVINIAIEEEKKLQQQIFDDEKELYTRISNNESILGNVRKIDSQYENREKKYSIVGEIARVANGDNNQRITFERYVLAAYFDDIIRAANLRLCKMTGDRYLLKRKEEKGKGRKQEGLELEVFDNYTGKARHVKTLSGGEGFKASLSLALGLADVVQGYAGGVTVDTMFVDEGFGTLDPESLDNAVNCLIELQQSNRLVGIISHVPELRERIDARLEITPAKEGSRAQFRI